MWPTLYGRSLAWLHSPPHSQSHQRWSRDGFTWDRHRATWVGPGFHAQRTVMVVRPEPSPRTVEVIDVTPEPEPTSLATHSWWDELKRRVHLAWRALRGEL